MQLQQKLSQVPVLVDNCTNNELPQDTRVLKHGHGVGSWCDRGKSGTSVLHVTAAAQSMPVCVSMLVP
jgi:hypothetical protein